MFWTFFLQLVERSVKFAFRKNFSARQNYALGNLTVLGLIFSFTQVCISNFLIYRTNLKQIQNSLLFRWVLFNASMTSRLHNLWRHAACYEKIFSKRSNDINLKQSHRWFTDLLSSFPWSFFFVSSTFKQISVKHPKAFTFLPSRHILILVHRISSEKCLKYLCLFASR